ncbi:MAG: DNA recombination/repair protein RecA, partial [Phycisphaerales bacterium]|nr:DNA recombination/repair protein RecA [Phycisphaerales bacterium]
MADAKDKDNREESRTEALSRALQQIEKSFGKGTIMYLNNQTVVPDGISTGSISVDLALGGTGVPRGRVIEVFGPESSGKTTLTLHIIAEAQRAGGAAAFIDAE